MVRTQIHTSLVILTLLLALCVSVTVAGDWRTLTSTNEVRRMKTINDTIFFATSGGLLIVADPYEPGEVLTNIDGLGTTDIADIVLDQAGQKWIAGLGRLIRCDDSNYDQFLFFDEDDELIRLTCLADDDDQIWIGTDLGLVLFSKNENGGQIQDSYGRFGQLPDFPTVHDILLEGDTIWLATSAGLAVADKSDPKLLKFPASWTTFDSQILGSGIVTRVNRFENDIYAATNEGLVKFEYDNQDTLATTLTEGAGSVVTELRHDNDTLFFYHEVGVGVVTTTGVASIDISALGAIPTNGLNNGSFRWLNVAGVGLYHDASGSIQEYPYTGLPSNGVIDITVDGKGVPGAAFSDRSVGRLQDGSWTMTGLPLSYGPTELYGDPDGDLWVGCFGNGLFHVKESVSQQYNNLNSTLIGNNDALPGSASYVVIFGLAFDDCYLYAGAYRAYNDYPLIIGDLQNLDNPSGWDAVGMADGLTNAFVSTLDVYHGEVAVGTEAEGIFVCRLGDDPFNRPSNSCQQYTEDNSFLRSNSISVIRYSPDGTLWVGTPGGLSRFDWGIDRFVDVDLPAGIDRDIRDLVFDGRGNLWVGTRNGLARFDATEGAFEIFKPLNSDLVSGDITALEYDEVTGDLYVATMGGISVIPSSFGKPVFSVDEVIAFPNPFVIRSNEDRLRFNFGLAGEVVIYNLTGEPVRRLDVNQTWGGRNETGNKVADGVYLFILTDSEGAIGRGKILLVRQ